MEVVAPQFHEVARHGNGQVHGGDETGVGLCLECGDNKIQSAEQQWFELMHFVV
jgi:hypothetical protein